MNEKQYQTISELLNNLNSRENHNQHEAWIAKHASLTGDPKKVTLPIMIWIFWMCGARRKDG